MTWESAGELVAQAYRAKNPCPALNVIQLEHIGAVIDAAQSRQRPVILAVSQNAIHYHGGMEPIAAAMIAAAKQASVPVGVHLDHAESFELIETAVRLGFPSVMFDGASLPYAENVRRTAEITSYCHEHGVWVEAELGEISGKRGAHAPDARTDPDEAEDFVHQTGVDALAVAVGTQHARSTPEREPNLVLIEKLERRLSIPLVLHGSSSVPHACLADAARAGLTKFNFGTALNREFTRAIRDVLSEDGALVDPRMYLGQGREAMRNEVDQLLGFLDRR